MSDDVAKLKAACKSYLGNPKTWITPRGYPESLALCIIDSIHSTGARYSSVERVLGRYGAMRGTDVSRDGVAELLDTFDAAGGAVGWAEVTNNRRPVSSARGAALKAEAIRDVASRLAAKGIEMADQFREAAPGTEAEELQQLWRRAPGQKSGLTWTYALMLAGVQGVKADRMVTRFVARATGSAPQPDRAATLVAAVAQDLHVPPIHLDHAIWRFESKRKVHRDEA